VRRLLAGVLFAATVACGGGSQGAAPAPAPASPASPGQAAACSLSSRNAIVAAKQPPAMCIDLAKTYRATVRTPRGAFTILLDPRSAPVTVNNFVVLAESHFYDGLTFHRVEPGFVVQGGDPAGDGSGGPAYKLPAETVAQDWSRGAVGMASSPAGVNGSQFFVLLGDAQYLKTSGVYNHFGLVDPAGMRVVDAIAKGDRIDGVDVAVS
jgi:peptidyl-prolyl cis-trans isomerase B (cyclophilin B)